MWRMIALVLAVYVWGTPSFDGLRPGPLDRAVRSFHQDLNHSMRAITTQVAHQANSRSVQFVDVLRRSTNGIGNGPLDRAAVAR